MFTNLTNLTHKKGVSKGKDSLHVRLQKLEAQDPMIKRALDVIRRMKVAEDDKDGAKSDKCSGGKCDKPNAPRKLKGLFAHKAPNETSHTPVK